MKSDGFHSTKNDKNEINGQIIDRKEMFAMTNTDKRLTYTI